MACDKSAMKKVLLGINILLALSGLALSGIGVMEELEISRVPFLRSSISTTILYPMLYRPSITTIVTGCLVFLVAIFGCIGAIRNSKWILISYVICLVGLMGWQITAGSFIYEYLPRLLLPDQSDISTLRENYVYNGGYFVEAFEKPLKCCGLSGPSSYNWMLTDSCCETPPCTAANAYDSCENKIYDLHYTFWVTTFISYFCVAAIELVAVTCGMIQACSTSVQNQSSRC